MRNDSDYFVLNNGVNIPCIGFGTWKIPEDGAVQNTVKYALECGYRHIDTAAIYKNETGIGQALKETNISRNEIFVTSKVWNTDRGYENTLRAFEKSMARLQLEVLDLYLIHWPMAKGSKEAWQATNHDTWRALEKLYEEKRVRAIGVSNFLLHHLEPLVEKANILPMVNQVEYHPGSLWPDTVAYCQENNILVEAWSPLGSGKLLEHTLLKELAEKYSKSVAQICLRFCLQNNVLPLPKSATDARIAENLRVFDFAISEEDMERLQAVPAFSCSGLHPDTVEF